MSSLVPVNAKISRDHAYSKTYCPRSGCSWKQDGDNIPAKCPNCGVKFLNSDVVVKPKIAKPPKPLRVFEMIYDYQGTPAILLIAARNKDDATKIGIQFATKGRKLSFQRDEGDCYISASWKKKLQTRVIEPSVIWFYETQ